MGAKKGPLSEIWEPQEEVEETEEPKTLQWLVTTFQSTPHTERNLSGSKEFPFHSIAVPITLTNLL